MKKAIDRDFKSTLKYELEAYLELRKCQGHNDRKERAIFLTLDRYIHDSQVVENEIRLIPDIIEGWLDSLPAELGVNSRNLYVSHYTQFARYLLSKGMYAFIPERSLPDMTYTPYIFSEEELYLLVMAADKRVETASPKIKYSVACFSILLRMLTGCGFRINELLNLKTSDVDSMQRVITVRNAKGKKDRIVPIHDTLAQILHIYASSGIPQQNGFFFPSETGKRFSYSWARDNYNKCVSSIGIIKPELKPHARNICIHCLRHSFAVAAFQKLYRDGKDLYSEAPVLSTYLGHKNIYGTEKYLHATPETNAEILHRMSEYSKKIFPEVSL